MASGLQNTWSITPASNATADTTINAAEGQAPSTLNDAFRGAMAAIAKWYKDTRGALVAGGTATAYTLTTNEGITLADGVSVTCRMNVLSGAAPTLNVDSTGAVAIQTIQGTALPLAALFPGGIYTFTYYASSAAWIVHGGIGVSNRYIGEVFDYGGASAPPLALLCYGQAISRTTYAALFSVISTTFGVGDGSTTFNVPDLRGRVVAGQDDMGGVSADRLTGVSGGIDGDAVGNVGGAETHQLTTAQLAQHSHAVTDPGHAHSYLVPPTPVLQVYSGFANSSYTDGAVSALSSGGTGAAVTGISIANAGSGTAHNNVQPTLILNKCIFAGA